MSMQAAFLADIVAHPEDDAPRLVYADWLEENGDPDRASFIRTQCRLASCGHAPERTDLLADEAALLAKNGKKWRKPLAKVTARVEFERGFPHRIALPIAKFITHGEDALAAAPTLREYRALQVAANWDQLLACPAFGRLPSLDAGYLRLGQGRVKALATSPHVAGLRELVLSGAKMLAGGLREVCASPHLAGLTRLELARNDLGDLAAEALAGSPHLKNLRSLDLSSNGLTATGIGRLARWEGAARLEVLKILEYEGADDAARAFAEGDWRSLHTLTLDLHDMRAAGMDAVGRCASLAGLKRLSVTHELGQPARGLLLSPHLAGLEHLAMTPGGAAGDFAALAEAPMLRSLRSLDVVQNREEGLGPVLASPAAAGLAELRVSGNNQSAKRLCARIAGATHMTGLRAFSLTDFEIDAGCIRALADAPHLAGLREMVLARAELTVAAAKALAGSPHLGRLRRLHIAPGAKSASEADGILKERFGDVATVVR